MNINDIVSKVNDELAGELLTYNELLPFLDQTIDDINAELDTNFPVFSEFSATTYPDNYPNYNFFPDRYIRNVVIKGTAYKFYVMDEEGIPTAQMYQYNYQDNMFRMVRDYLEDVPDEYKADHKASVVGLSDVAYKDEEFGDYRL